MFTLGLPTSGALSGPIHVCTFYTFYSRPKCVIYLITTTYFGMSIFWAHMSTTVKVASNDRIEGKLMNHY